MDIQEGGFGMNLKGHGKRLGFSGAPSLARPSNGRPTQGMRSEKGKAVQDNLEEKSAQQFFQKETLGNWRVKPPTNGRCRKGRKNHDAAIWKKKRKKRSRFG